MAPILFAAFIGGWLFVIAGELSGFWQVGTFVLAFWFLTAALWNAWFFSRED
jgi:hypothetical protein